MFPQSKLTRRDAFELNICTQHAPNIRSQQTDERTVVWLFFCESSSRSHRFMCLPSHRRTESSRIEFSDYFHITSNVVLKTVCPKIRLTGYLLSKHERVLIRQSYNVCYFRHVCYAHLIPEFMRECVYSLNQHVYVVS